MAPFLFLFILFFLVKNKKWFLAILLSGTCLFFLLLVIVCFREYSYDYYYEHILQPLPFFIALAFGYIDIKLHRYSLFAFCFIIGVFTISLVKIKNGHVLFERRLCWERHYLNLMSDMSIQKAALSRTYITIGDRTSYWSAPSETLLLSSLGGADSSKTLFLVWNFNHLGQNLQDSTIIAYDGSNVPLSGLNPEYFGLNHSQPYIILDSVVDKSVLHKLSQVR